MSTDKKFTIEEVSKILESATQLQKGKSGSNQEGLSAEEILQIARESGIDEHAVTSAIDNLNNQLSESQFSWLRGTKEVTVSDTINQEITDDDWNEVLKVVRKRMGPVNVIENSGPHYECDQMVDEITYSHLALTTKNGKTRIDYSSNWTGLKFIMYFFFLLVPSIVGIVIGLKNDWTWYYVFMSALAGTFTGYGLGKFILKSLFEGQKRKLKNVISEIKSRLIRTNQSRITIEEESERSSDAQNTSSSKIRS